MQYQYIGHRLKGFYKIASLATKWEALMSTEAEQKHKALLFWCQHGLSATQDAFQVSRSTLYSWRTRYRNGGLSALHDRSKAPHHRRCHWSAAIHTEIKRLRSTYPNIGSAKIVVLLCSYCLTHHLVSEPKNHCSLDPRCTR